MIKKKITNYYKVFIQYLFKILYGKIDGVLDPKNHKEIYQEEIIIEHLKYKLFNCKNAVLYTDTIHDTAIIKNNKIIEGPSFQYRKNINKHSSFNSVLTKGTPKIRKVINGNVYSLLVGGGGNSNYWHWLFDVLPKLQIFRNSNYFQEQSYFLFPSLDQNFQNQSLDILGVPKKNRLSSKIFRHFKADKIIITNHPYNFLNDPNKDSLNIPLWIFEFIKKSFLKNSIINLSKNKQFPKKIYISRKDGTALRYIINETEVKNLLLKHGFEELILSEYDFASQINIFHHAETVVGLHGAGFANILFCKEGTKILELKPLTAGEIIKNVSIKNKLKYSDITVQSKSINFKDQSGDIIIDLKKLMNKIKN